MISQSKVEYTFNKYKTFIEVWNNSKDIEEVRNTLLYKHGWYAGMEERWTDRDHNDRHLSLNNVKGYENRLRRKGVQLRYLHDSVDTPYNEIDYSMLNDFARNY